MLKQKKGITLVALVITIIVLLILAGVSISLVVGDNGVLSNAKEAATKTKISQIKEGVQRAMSSLQTEYYAKDYTDDETEGTTVDSFESYVESNSNLSTALTNENLTILNNGSYSSSNKTITVGLDGENEGIEVKIEFENDKPKITYGTELKKSTT